VNTAAQAVAEAYQREWGQVVAVTVRLTRDLDLAEDAVQESYVRALRAWAERGVPDRPGAWLTTTAKRIAINAMARNARLRDKLPLLAEVGENRVTEGREEIADDLLRLIFICCHPALAESARLALTLRLVCGLPTADVARLMLTSETAMAARITRGKKKVQSAGLPFAVPTAEELPERIDAVLVVIYLMFTAGHTASSGSSLVRLDITARAVDLMRTLRSLMPASEEIAALLALMLFSEARAATRYDARGRVIRLEDQDRSRWDHRLIREGLAHLRFALRRASHGRFTVEAAIASVHATARTSEATDWHKIRSLYDSLLTAHPSPVVALNRAIAVSHAQGVRPALEIVEELVVEGRLDGHVYLHATRAELLRRIGAAGEATRAYRRALELTQNDAERQFLSEQVAALEASPISLPEETPCP
jgi:RNA polymerase sigma-70 factor, ECF subfamily